MMIIADLQGKIIPDSVNYDWLDKDNVNLLITHNFGCLEIDETGYNHEITPLENAQLLATAFLNSKSTNYAAMYKTTVSSYDFLNSEKSHDKTTTTPDLLTTNTPGTVNTRSARTYESGALEEIEKNASSGSDTTKSTGTETRETDIDIQRDPWRAADGERNSRKFWFNNTIAYELAQFISIPEWRL